MSTTSRVTNEILGRATTQRRWMRVKDDQFLTPNELVLHNNQRVLADMMGDLMKQNAEAMRIMQSDRRQRSIEIRRTKAGDDDEELDSDQDEEEDEEVDASVKATNKTKKGRKPQPSASSIKNVKDIIAKDRVLLLDAVSSDTFKRAGGKPVVTRTVNAVAYSEELKKIVLRQKEDYAKKGTSPAGAASASDYEAIDSDELVHLLIEVGKGYKSKAPVIEKNAPTSQTTQRTSVKAVIIVEDSSDEDIETAGVIAPRKRQRPIEMR